MLLERKLIRVLGRKEIPGRPLIYATTKEFLQVFDLKNLKDLPTPKEIEALAQDPDLEDDQPDESEAEASRSDVSGALDESGSPDQDTKANSDSEPDQKGLDEET